MKKTGILAFCLLLLTAGLRAQERTVGMLPGERWWGCVTDLGVRMPFDASTELSFDLATQNFNNQTTPLLVSDKGRYIWCDSSFSVSISGGEIRIAPHHGGAVTCVQAGTTLREAFLAASAAHFPPSGTIPPEMFLNKPQYNTWIELVYDQNQADVLKYAHGIVDNGFPPGILMIDDNWQKYYGSTEFRPDRFPDPKGMVDELHALGFKVMLWICPFVSPDSQEYRMLRDKGYLVMDAGRNRPAILDWWNGLSACYDLSNPEAYAYYKGTLTALQEKFGIDGFKFDAGDPERYLQENTRPFDGKSFDTAQTMLWARLGLEFPYNEFRACWRMGGDALVQRLGDKNYSWQAVASLVPDMIAAGLLGHRWPPGGSSMRSISPSVCSMPACTKRWAHTWWSRPGRARRPANPSSGAWSMNSPAADTKQWTDSSCWAGNIWSLPSWTRMTARRSSCPPENGATIRARFSRAPGFWN